jgi:CBS domain-containing protein
VRVSDVMDPKAARTNADITFEEAAQILALSGAGELMVVEDDGTFVGVVSEADLLRAMMPEFEELEDAGSSLQAAAAAFLAAGRRQADQPIRRVTIRDSLAVGLDDDLLKAATLMTLRDIRRLPVVDSGMLRGAVSQADVCWGLLCAPAGPPAGPPEGVLAPPSLQ